MRVATYASENRAGLVNLLNSAALFGVKVDVLGKGQPWSGWRTRARAFLDYCAAAPDPRELVLLVAPFDTLFARPLDAAPAFADAFRSVGAPIVFGAAAACWSDCRAPKAAGPAPTADEAASPFVNPGAIAGLAGALAELYRWCLQSNHASEAAAYAAFAEARPEAARLDRRGALSFADAYGTSGEYVLEGARAVEDPLAQFAADFAGPRVALAEADDDDASAVDPSEVGTAPDPEDQPAPSTRFEREQRASESRVPTARLAAKVGAASSGRALAGGAGGPAPFVLHFPESAKFQSAAVANLLFGRLRETNYAKVGKHLLGHYFIADVPLDSGLQTASSGVALAVFALLLVLLLAAVLYIALAR